VSVDNRFIRNRKYIAVNLILFAVLFLSVSFNKNYIRPVYRHHATVGVITGSFSNFMAAWVTSLFSFTFILVRKLQAKKARLFFYGASVFVFIALAVEEIVPYTGASSTCDAFDIAASGIGVLAAIATYEIFLKKRIVR